MQDNQQEFILAAIRYYAGCLRLRVKCDDPIFIGLPLQLYFPKYRTAIELSDIGENRHTELLKDQLCRKYEINMIRILIPGVQPYPSDSCLCIQMIDFSEETIEEVINSIFYLIGMNAGVNIVRDGNAINELFRISDDSF